MTSPLSVPAILPPRGRMTRSCTTTSFLYRPVAGLPVFISELDIRGSDADEPSQLAQYQTLFPALYEHRSVAGVTLWGYIEASAPRTSHTRSQKRTHTFTHARSQTHPPRNRNRNRYIFSRALCTLYAPGNILYTRRAGSDVEGAHGTLECGW